MLFLSAIIVVAASVVDAVQASTFSPLRPPAIPLAVASPYLNTWLRADDLPGTWPTFWNGAATGWQGFISVDDTVYNWMGGAPNSPYKVMQTAFTYTSTRSIFTFDVVGKVNMTATFLTPVYPNDLVKKSLQHSYVDVSVVATDGQTHNVSVYMDISAEWASADLDDVVQWDTGTHGAIRYHRVCSKNQIVYQEFHDQATWGEVLLATESDGNLTYQIGSDSVVRRQFVSKQFLNNTVDTNYRAVSDKWPVFAYARNLGTVGSSPADALFGIGISQVNTVKFQGAGSSPQSLKGHWNKVWTDSISAMADWIAGYATEAAYSTTIDQQVWADSEAAQGPNYAAITTLAVRQAFAALQPGYGENRSYVFLKEISSNGDTSTVDVTYPTLPLLQYFNVTLVKLLLDPLYENQESGKYPNKYAEHDLGTFPNALGYPNGDDEAMPIEECGNMLIMTLAYAQKSGDTDYLTKHFALLQKWTGFLINDSLIPSSQISTDDFAGPLANQTNLALKGIIGIASMGKIAQLTGQEDTYTSVAQSYISRWYERGINNASSPPHSTLSYGQDASYGLLYNLYADKLLGLGLVGQWVYDMQDAFYPTIMSKYGVPLDTRHEYTKLDWQCWVAAISGNATRTKFYDAITTWLGNTTARAPMTDWYWLKNGTMAGGFQARPVVGGVFAQLVL